MVMGTLGTGTEEADHSAGTGGAAPAGGTAPEVWHLPAEHIPALDGVRGLAILLVMVYHQTLLQGTTAADRVFDKIAGFGWCGVDLFFVLSGFLITGILFDAKGEKHYFRNFYARRAVRIFPLYYAVVVFSLLILPLIPHPKADNFGRVAGDELWYWTYLSNFLIAKNAAFQHGILDISWSLAIEEQFYLVWPAVVLLLNRRRLMVACGVLAAAALVSRLMLLTAGFSSITIYVLTSSRVDALAVGAWIALAMRGEVVAEKVASQARRVVIVTAAVLLALWLRMDRKEQWGDQGMLGVGYTVLAVFFGAVLVLALTSGAKGGLGRFFSNPWLRMFGKYSYAMYLFHLPLRAAVRDLALAPSRVAPGPFGSQLPAQLLFYIVATGLTFGAAWLSWNLYEKHFLKLKRFFPQHRRAARRAAAGGARGQTELVAVG